MKTQLHVATLACFASLLDSSIVAADAINDKQTRQVIFWALGDGERPPKPEGQPVPCPDGCDKKPPPKDTKDQKYAYNFEHVKGTSLLPGPPGDSRLFYISDGKLYKLLPHAEQPQQLVLPGVSADTQLVQLVASSRDAKKLALLALVKSASRSDAQLWQFQLQGDAVVEAKPASENPAFADATKFFRDFHTPRCHAGGTDCLVLVKDNRQHFLLYQEPKRGAQRTKKVDLGKDEIVDYVWASPTSTDIVLLVAPRA